MSINLVAVDLTSASVGTNGIVKLPFPSVQEGELAHLRVYNESGCGLTILFDNGHQEVIPAGAWPMFEIEPVVRQYSWTVTYVLPNAPVALLSAVYYFPYEGVPPTPALGNSPIGVTGGVTTSSVQTLSNENSILGTKIVDIGSLTISDLFDIFNDHFTFKVQQSGVAHTVLQGQTAGNPLLIGQAGDTSEVLGNLLVDGGKIGKTATGDTLDASDGANLKLNALSPTGQIQLEANGTPIFNAFIDTGHNYIQSSNDLNLFVNGSFLLIGTSGGDIYYSTKGAGNIIQFQIPGGVPVFSLTQALAHFQLPLQVDQAATLTGLLTATGQITGAAAQDLTLNAVTGHQVRALINNALVMAVDAGGLNISSKKLFDTSSNNLADWTADGLYLKGNVGNVGGLHYQGDGINNDFRIQAMTVVSFNTVNGTTATINHNLKVANVGVVPDAIIANAFSTGVSAANVTIGLSEVGATTFKATSIAAVPAKAICVKF